MTRRLLPLIGFALFLVAWQLCVVLTRPGLVRSVTLALATPIGDSTCVVVLSGDGHVAARETLPLDSTAVATSTAKLLVWIGSLQPTVAGLPAHVEPQLEELLRDAQRQWGGGLDVEHLDLGGQAQGCE